ncbi:MOSC domain-containing protein [Clostridium lacusfryxellense]|uniref:MOSC domain-containing protein n=1 Tax=Clostridium lacusfryxellense TaxID=205328 RepID=UPI001C0B6C01|nr:MOSC domain-containing protein [Clostridium lacusfryxellense]MBU3109965.1 MOSC domain-containing protein [Clostridium lacusfryxellense]
MKKLGMVVSINISEKKGVVKNPIKSGNFITQHGLENDAHAGDWHRQVSLLATESIDKMIAKGAKGLTYGKFAENLTTQGLVLYELKIGTRLIIGETIQEVTQIGKECHNGCEIKRLVGECIMPKEGIFTRIIKGGIINNGDSIYLDNTTK